MAAKIKTNETGDCIFTEQDAIDLLYADPDFDITKLFFEDTIKFNSSVKDTGVEFGMLQNVPVRESITEFDQKNINNWHMPEQYYQINVLEWLLEKCQNEEEKTVWCLF